MTLRLVTDVVRRKWLVIGFAVFQIYFFRKASWNFWPQLDPLTWLLLFAAFVTVPAGAMLESREIYQLPVSRRAQWVARWWLSTLGAVLVVVPAVSVAEWSATSRWPSLDQLAMSSTLAFLYCGCVVALAATQLGRWADKPLAIQPPRADATPPQPVAPVNLGWVIFKAFLRVVPGLLGLLALPMVAPFVFARYLPHTFSSFSTLSSILVLAMTACTVWAYLYHPAIQARPSRRIVRPTAPRSDAVGRSQTPERVEPTATAKGSRLVDRLTGLALPFWQASRKYLITYSTVIALGVTWWWVTSFYKPVPELSSVLGRSGMLPLASPRAHVTESITIGVLFIITGMLEVGLLANIRPLRVLPLSTVRLCCIPLGLALASATMLWTVLLVLHVLVLHTVPVSFRTDLFIAFVALTALSNVLRFTVPGQPPTRAMIGFAPLGIIWLAVGYFDSFRTDIVQPATFVGGLLVLAGSFALMRYAVTRSSRIYQQRATMAPF